MPISGAVGGNASMPSRDTNLNLPSGSPEFGAKGQTAGDCSVVRVAGAAVIP